MADDTVVILVGNFFQHAACTFHLVVSDREVAVT